MTFNTLLVVAAIAVATGGVSCVWSYLRWHAAAPPGAAPTVLGYFGLAALFTFGAYVAGSGAGIALACAEPAGNLCGIWGALGSGPLAAGLALAAYGPLRRARSGV